MMDTQFQKAEKFIYHNARPLDLARWQYHFENGDKETVLYMLSTYQNEDGSWGIPWQWNDFSEEWSISKNWWKGNGILVNMLFLKGMGKLKK